MDKADIDILVNMMPGNTRPPDFAVKLLEDTCHRTGVDWKMRHCYLMNRGGKWMVTLSIDGFRLIGSQDADYGGQDGPFFVTEPSGTWSDIPPDAKPYAAKVGIKHRNGTTTWGVAKYSDYKASPMWDKFPTTMVAKCAEMLAWRKAFPGKLGGLYGVEEMAQAGVKLSGPTEAPPEEKAQGEAIKALQDKARELEESYRAELDAQTSLIKLNALGKRINGEKNLDMGTLLRLSAIYDAKKLALKAGPAADIEF